MGGTSIMTTSEDAEASSQSQSTGSSAVAAMRRRMEDDRIQFVRLQFSDLEGQPKNVSIPVHQLQRAPTSGIGFDGSSIEGFVRIEESDMVLKPDLATYAVLPWRKEVARLVCDVYTSKGVPFEGDPRNVLKRVLKQAEELGFQFNTGPEMEFFLFKLDEHGKPTTELLDSGGYFDMCPTDLAQDVRRDIISALTEMGFNVEASHHEVAASQHEIDFRYGDALAMADNVITFKFATKTIAVKNGLHATFMAKPIQGINGSGMHTNCSLFRDGKNAFYDPNRAPLMLSSTATHFIAGILRHIPGVTRLANPTINSYKRLVHGYEAPVYVSWSAANRSALVRVPDARGSATRVEIRSPDPTCNPYLTFAAILAAGLDGIRNRLVPPDPVQDNVFERHRRHHRHRRYDDDDDEDDNGNNKGLDMLPGDLMEANAALVADPVLCDVLGAHVVENLTRIAEAEWESFRTTVHQWEVDRYLANH